MFYQQLKKLCHQNGVTISQVTSELKMSVSNVTRWKKGMTPRADTVKVIADYFGVPTDYLLSAPENGEGLETNISNSGSFNNNSFIQGNRASNITVTSRDFQDKDVESIFYEQLQKLCRQRGLSITRLTSELKMGNSNVHNWKNGAIPRAATVKAIADYFRVAPEYLLTGVDKPVIKNNNPKKDEPNTTATNAGVQQKNLNIQEIEILRIYNELDIKHQTLALSYLFKLEEEFKASK